MIDDGKPIPLAYGSVILRQQSIFLTETMEATTKVKALKAQMEREMERRRAELAEHDHYEGNPYFGAF